MTVAASKLDDFFVELDNLEKPLLPFRAKQIERDLKALLRQVHPSEGGEIYLALGVLFNRIAKYEDAIQEHERASRLIPGDPRPYIGIAANFLTLGQVQDAVDILIPIVAVDGPFRLRACLNLATGLRGLGRLEESKNILMEAEGLVQPANVGDLFLLAMTAANAHFRREALLYYAWFLRASAGQLRDDTQALQTVRLAHHRTENLREAVPELAQIVDAALSLHRTQGGVPEPQGKEGGLGEVRFPLGISDDVDFAALEQQIRETLTAQGLDAESVLQRATEAVQRAPEKASPPTEAELQRATDWVIGRS